MRVSYKPNKQGTGFLLIVGLGNPGSTYRDTRHNFGFRVVASLAAKHDIALDKRKFNVDYGNGSIRGQRLFLAMPQAYMNRSGPGTRRLADYFRISSNQMLVVHDDIDLEFGRLKIKEKGGSGGHNGLRSLMDAFGCGDFARLRLGIGRSGLTGSVTNHVLGKFSPREGRYLEIIVDKAVAAIETIISKGIDESMNRFNVRNMSISNQY